MRVDGGEWEKLHSLGVAMRLARDSATIEIFKSAMANWYSQ